MKLIDLLVNELPKQGGWPEKAALCIYYGGGQDVVYFWTEKNNKACQPKKMRIPSIIIYDEITKEQYEAALAASNQPEWNGEGLPPVGTKCEWQDKNTKAWLPVIVAYASEWVTVIREGDKIDAVEIAIENYGDEARRQFRPIRTEAERKREEAGLAIYHAINWNAEGEIASPARMEDYRKAYDAIAAGKIPGIRLTDDAGN